MIVRGWIVPWLAGLRFIALFSGVAGMDMICANPPSFSGTENDQSWNDAGTTKMFFPQPRKVLFCCLGFNPIGSQDHFVEVDSEEQCEPFCSPACPENSSCVPPTDCECVSNAQFYSKQLEVRKCKCNPGFTLTAQEHCFPVCPGLCTNGVCTNNKCVCNAGYQANESGLCSPRCFDGCREGEVCTGPNVCSQGTSCENDKYERNATGHCVPKCDDCSNDRCVCAAAEKCVSVAGYTFNSDSNKCEALCNNCSGDMCTAPGVCSCSPGYHNVNGACVLCTDAGPPGCSETSVGDHFKWVIIEVHVIGVLFLLAMVVIVIKCRAKRRRINEMMARSKEFKHDSRDRFHIRVDPHRAGHRLRPPCPLPRPKDSDSDSIHTDGEYVEVIEECTHSTPKTAEMTIPTYEPHYEEIRQTKGKGKANAKLPSYELPFDPLASSQRRSPRRCNNGGRTPELPPRKKDDKNVSELDTDGYLEPKFSKPT